MYLVLMIFQKYAKSGISTDVLRSMNIHDVCEELRMIWYELEHVNDICEKLQTKWKKVRNDTK